MKNLLLFFWLFLIVLGCGRTDESLNVYDLKCENLSSPLGVNTSIPRFSWKIKSEKKGTEQAAFQVLVASEKKLLKEGKADLWDSEITETESSVWVAYQGTELKAGSHAFWKVRIKDEAGNISNWSEPAEFGIGLLHENDWQAEYITFNTDAGYQECPQLYKSFELQETDSKLLLQVNSLGYHEVFVNGKKVGDGVLTPAVSQFDKRSLVNTYDISSYVKKGKNDLILWLGSGWYTEGLPGVVNNGPVVKAQLEKVEGNYSEVILKTDSSWLGRESSYTRHGNWRPHRFGGELIDGSLTKTDLAVDDTNRSWQKISVIEVPEHELSPQMTELNRIQDTLNPTAVVELSKDTFLVDMGKNLTGWVKVHFRDLKKAQEVKLEYCDHLTNEGMFNDRNQYDKYIASGKSPEIFQNKFNYHGFRYIRVSGLDEMPDPDSICAYLIHTDYELASGFECSDQDLNAIHDMIFYTLRCLSIGGDLVDCPQIERLGYGGDGNASTVTAQTMFNLGPLYTNWLQAWADVIREDGGMPHTAPNPYNAGGGPYWCGFIISASWNTYLNYGDASILQKYYPVMQKWLGYVDKYSVDGLLKPWPNTEYRNWFLGDWATPEGIDQTDEASVHVVNNSYLAVCYDQMNKIAQVLGKQEDAGKFKVKKEQLQTKIHEVYFSESDNSYGTGTQIDLAFPMISGVVPENLYEKVKQSLYKETNMKWDGHLACGLVGIPVVTQWTVENGEADLMYSMLKKRDYPGYLYMIDNGATTTWEHWNGERSRIHNCYNGIGSWFYEAIGGIRQAENVPMYQKVIIQPQVPKGITWAKTFKETPFGRISVNWELDGEMMTMSVDIPVGSEADVLLPETVKEYDLEGKRNITQNINSCVNLKSGQYVLNYKL